jgi:hypothetical protein
MALVFGLAVTGPSLLFAEDLSSVRPLLTLKSGRWQALLPSDTHLLIEPGAIERFLDALDGAPPDWATVYGQGHHDAGLDDRLFSLNRARDAHREGKSALAWRVTFLWPGELSDYDPKRGGFRVAVGPTVTPTRWGLVRFKPEDLPGNLMAIPAPQSRAVLRRRIEHGEAVEIHVALTGKLIPEESLIYDFSHDGEGRGVIMPVVRIDRIDFVLVQ